MANQFPEYKNENFQIPTTQLPHENPKLIELMKKQRQKAQDFRANMPGYADSIYKPYERSAKAGLVDTIRDTRRSFNRRGLYGSGMQTGAEYAAKGQTAADLSAKRMDVNRLLENQATQMEGAPLATAYNIAGQNPMLGQASLNGLASGLDTDIANMNAQQALWTGGGQGIGNLISTMLAARRG